MSIMRSWPRSPRSTSCAPLSSWNRAPNPNPNPILGPSRSASITKTTDEAFSCYRIKLGHTDAAKFDAALQSHHDALIAEWKHDHDNGDHDNGDHDNGDPMATAPQISTAVAEHR